jgi:hypothetical protein
VRALKTNNAIVTWVREQAPLAQMIGVHSCLWRAQLQLYGEETAERAALKIGTRYPLRDAILVGLDDWEAEPLNDSVILVES